MAYLVSTMLAYLRVLLGWWRWNKECQVRWQYTVLYFERFSLEISLSIEVTGAGMSHAAKKINPPNNVKEIKIKTINADFIFQTMVSNYRFRSQIGELGFGILKHLRNLKKYRKCSRIFRKMIFRELASGQLSENHKLFDRMLENVWFGDDSLRFLSFQS